MEDKQRFYKGATCKICKRPITVKNKSGLCRSHGMMGTKRALGFRHTQLAKLAIAKTKIGCKNPMWKGDRVKIKALHIWVITRFSKPSLCQICLSAPPYDLANKGIYNRKIINWYWLCRRCHMLSDGRMKNLIQFREKK